MNRDYKDMRTQFELYYFTLTCKRSELTIIISKTFNCMHSVAVRTSLSFLSFFLDTLISQNLQRF